MLTAEGLKNLEQSTKHFGIVTIKERVGYEEDPYIAEPTVHRVFTLQVNERSVDFFSFEKGWYMNVLKTEIESFQIDTDYHHPRQYYLMHLLEDTFNKYKGDQIDRSYYVWGTEIVNNEMDIIADKALNTITEGPFYHSFVGDYKEERRKGAFLIGNTVSYQEYDATKNYPFVSKKFARTTITDNKAALDYLGVANDSLVQSVIQQIQSINERILPVCDPHVKPLSIELSVSISHERCFALTMKVYYTFSKEFASLNAIKRPIEKVLKVLEQLNNLVEEDLLPF